MTKVKPSNGNETESDIFPWDVFKSHHHICFIKKYQNIWTNLNKFMKKVNVNNAIETKSDIFSVQHIQIWRYFLLVVKY